MNSDTISVSPESNRLNPISANIEQILLEAEKTFRSAHLTQSEALYQQILAREPKHPDALHGFGLIKYESGDLDQAITLIEQAIEGRPDFAEACNNAAKIYAELEQWDEVVAKCLQAIKAVSVLVKAHIKLGVLYQAQHRLEEAKQYFQKILINKPNLTAARDSLGNVLRGITRVLVAINQTETGQSISKLSHHQQSEATKLFNQGIGGERQGMLNAAMAFYQQTIEVKPDFTGAYNNLGMLLMLQGRYPEALINFLSVVSLEPNVFIGHSNISNVLRHQKRLDDAVDSIRQAITLEPKRAHLYVNLALLLKEQGELEYAAAETGKALQLQSDFVDAYLNLGHIRILEGRVREGIELRRKALKLNPNHVEAESALFISKHYLPDYSQKDLLEAARNWAARHTSAERCLPRPDNSPDPRRRLRIGYVSGDFFRHPVASFIETILAHHDKTQYEVYCYYNSSESDNVTKRLWQYADHWRNIAGLADEKVARQIRGDGIDLLIDLTGHMDRNRLLTFALKPAPVQATWIGAPTTTGLTSMDYIIADHFAIPDKKDSYYVEKVVRLPNAYMCFSPPDVATEPKQLPAIATGKITFGSFNNTSKITEEVITCWSRLLNILPESRLFLKYKAFGDAGVRQYYQGRFASQGVDAGRIKFCGATTLEQHFSAYNEVDIGLDPFPYNGATTTVEALWMGVPVVSLRGDRFVSRMGTTLLTNTGLKDCVVKTQDAYIAKAMDLAADLTRLAELRSGLRSQLLNSPLCDGPKFTRDLEAAYRSMWKTWCANNSISSTVSKHSPSLEEQIPS